MKMLFSIYIYFFSDLRTLDQKKICSFFYSLFFFHSKHNLALKWKSCHMDRKMRSSSTNYKHSWVCPRIYTYVHSHGIWERKCLAGRLSIRNGMKAPDALEKARRDRRLIRKTLPCHLLTSIPNRSTVLMRLCIHLIDSSVGNISPLPAFSFLLSQSESLEAWAVIPHLVGLKRQPWRERCERLLVLKEEAFSVRKRKDGLKWGGHSEKGPIQAHRVTAKC